MVLSLLFPVDSTGYFRNTFCQQIRIPGEISIHLIGRNIYFYIEIRFLVFKAPLQNCNGGLKIEIFISS